MLKLLFLSKIWAKIFLGWYFGQLFLGQLLCQKVLICLALFVLEPEHTYPTHTRVTCWVDPPNVDQGNKRRNQPKPIVIGSHVSKVVSNFSLSIGQPPDFCTFMTRQPNHLDSSILVPGGWGGGVLSYFGKIVGRIKCSNKKILESELLGRNADVLA